MPELALEVEDYPGLRSPAGSGRLRLGQGEALLVRGESGAGKTRFLRRLVDLDPVPAGIVRLGGVPLPSIPTPELRRRIGYLPQEPVRFPGSGREHLARIRTLRANRARCLPPAELDALLERLELRDLLDRPLAQLSGGENRRLALVTLLQLRPLILLLDEPTTGLDSRRAGAVLAIVAEVRQGGSAILWTTHETAAVPDADTVWIERP